MSVLATCILERCGSGNPHFDMIDGRPGPDKRRGWRPTAGLLAEAKCLVALCMLACMADWVWLSTVCRHVRLCGYQGLVVDFVSACLTM